MHPATQQRLLALNRTFYATVAAEFDRTRAGLPAGWTTLAPHLPYPKIGQPVNVLDAGCGNGRFARFLDDRRQTCHYLGLDADATLLALAAAQTDGLPFVHARFAQTDLADPEWSRALHLGESAFDLVVCLAVLHHLPGVALRTQLLAELAARLRPEGLLVLSNWQFLTSVRFRQKLAPWSTIGLDPAEVETGDALLPWNQGVHALRYVHQVDEEEVSKLANATGLVVECSFYADGKEGALNLYSLLRCSSP